MGRVVFLSQASIHSRAGWHGVASSPSAGFSARDRAVLDAWSRDGRRAVACHDELGLFVMLYEAGCCWASWGIVRRGRGVSLWNCVTHEDIDEFASFAAAVAAIEPAGEVEVGTVVPFGEPRARRLVGL